jgi:hypothetical protein
MYQVRKTCSLHPKTVTVDSVNVPTPYSRMPAAHHRRCGPERRSSHLAKITHENASVITVVAIGMK